MWVTGGERRGKVGTRAGRTPPYTPGSQAPCPQAHEHRADELPEGGGVDRVQLVLLAMTKVMVVQRTPGQADPFRGFVIVQQPLELGGETPVGAGKIPFLPQRCKLSPRKDLPLRACVVTPGSGSH